MTMTAATTFAIGNAAAVNVALASACLKAVSVVLSIRMALVQAGILSVSPLKTSCWPHHFISWVSFQLCIYIRKRKRKNEEERNVERVLICVMARVKARRHIFLIIIMVLYKSERLENFRIEKPH